MYVIINMYGYRYIYIYITTKHRGMSSNIVIMMIAFIATGTLGT